MCDIAAQLWFSGVVLVTPSPKSHYHKRKFVILNLKRVYIDLYSLQKHLKQLSWRTLFLLTVYSRFCFSLYTVFILTWNPYIYLFIHGPIVQLPPSIIYFSYTSDLPNVPDKTPAIPEIGIGTPIAESTNIPTCSSPVPLPEPLMERSLSEPSVVPIEPAPEEAKYELVEEASQQRRTKLIDSRGYSYNVKRRTKSRCVKQVLLVFMLMSGWRKKDYKKVYIHLLFFPSYIITIGRSRIALASPFCSIVKWFLLQIPGFKENNWCREILSLFRKWWWISRKRCGL